MLFRLILALLWAKGLNMPSRNSASLYGISRENSSRHSRNLWGKNQFNSTFPLSLCLFMRDNEMQPVCLVVQGEELAARENHWKMSEVIGEAALSPFYQFECVFEPYAHLSRNKVDKIDLVVAIQERHHTALEVKLTVVPDVTTARLDENEWAPEMVMRPVSSAYAMMGVATSLRKKENGVHRTEVLNSLRPAYNKISEWNNKVEVEQNLESLTDALSNALQVASEVENPFLVQPIWRTKGQSLDLCEECFDVFVWSDVAIMKLPIHQVQKRSRSGRPMREIARHVRALYQVLTQGDFDYQGIYKGMSMESQTDKSFSIAGKDIRKFMNHARLNQPSVSRSVVRELILNGGQHQLKPERRFDAAVLWDMLPRRKTVQTYAENSLG